VWCWARKVEKEDGVGKVWVWKLGVVDIFVNGQRMDKERTRLERNMCCVVKCLGVRRDALWCG
jgi:hypothetical protein